MTKMPRLPGRLLLALTAFLGLFQEPGTRDPATAAPPFLQSSAEAFETAERLREQGGEVPLRRAEMLYRLSITGSRTTGDLAAESESWSRLAEVRRSLGNLQGALVAFEAAIIRFRALGRRDREVEALNSQGRVYRLMGQLDQAAEVYGQALRIARAIDFLPGEAVAFNNIGMLRYHTGEIDLALPAFHHALSIWLRLGEDTRAATTLGNIGSAYLLAGRSEDAAKVFQRSLALARSGGDRNAEATALTELGWCQYLQKHYSVAIELLQKAIATRRASGDRLGEAGALDRLGSAQREMGDLEQARQSYAAALSILTESGSLSGQAHTLCNVCQLQLISRQTAPARQSCDRALTIFRKTEDRNGEAHALYLRAQLLEQEGRREEAARASELAIDLLDNLWTHAAGRALRTSYLETRYTYYEHYISTLMEIHRFHPDGGYDMRALKASERARSRNLLEALLHSAAARGTTGKYTIERRSLAEALSRGRSLEIKKIRSMLTPETLLLAYSVGERASYLWWISQDEIGSQGLPGRRRLEEMIFRTRALLTNPRAEPVQTRLAMESLGELLVGPALRNGKYQRLILVPDGPLHYVPFGALSTRAQSQERGGSAAAFVKAWEPLLVHYDLMVAPSLSVLQLLRERHESGHKTIAVFADPVFSPDDPRIARKGGSVSQGSEIEEPPIPGSIENLRRSAKIFESKSWRRLPDSRTEALRITSLIAPGDRFLALDFAARRELALQDSMADYRILHFATHSALNEQLPEHSGIVLSLVDEQALPIDGLLRASDVLNLKLSADLVVLSGCRTALGRETRSEGLVGLSQAFLVAGARSLLVSLWDVDDQATSKLMANFYDNLLLHKRTPAEALQAAQLSLRAEGRYQAPYYWAAFVLIGDGGPQTFSIARLNNRGGKGSSPG